MDNSSLLDINQLHVAIDTYGGTIQAVRGVNFQMKKGEVLAIVGESGCGKSVLAQTIMRLLPSPPCRIQEGSIVFDGKIDLAKATEEEMQQIRGSMISMIFQDPLTSLNPTMRIGQQIVESIIQHQKLPFQQAWKQAQLLLDKAGIQQPEWRMKQYPHQLSGGMRQRVMITMALANQPKLIIADEPTTALDATIQKQILKLLKHVQQQSHAGVLLISHDLGVVADIAHRMMVMYAGQIVETGTARELFLYPKHPYTRGLLDSIPHLHLNRTHELKPIPGQPPDLFTPPKGCAFAERCPHTMQICLEKQPDMMPANQPHQAACWLLHPDVKKTRKRTGGPSP